MNTSQIKTNPKVRVIEAISQIRHQSAGKTTVEIPLKRVCAYCRVSTDQEEQLSSYDLQVKHYTSFINNNKSWEFAGIFADEGISGTSIKRRNEFQKMIQACEDDKIDMIITKSISRFARNTLDCLNYVRKLKNLPHPVGIFFEKENIDTLDGKSELLLTILSSLAQDESRSTSENIKWAIQKKFQAGIPRCPTVFFLGYDTDENGNLVINDEQAETIRRIYREYLAGDGSGLIAKHLTKDRVKTGRGNVIWTPNAIYRILTNEKYCGDILMQKQVTIDFLTHKRVINNGYQPQYFISDHHPAIIPKDKWNAVQAELARRNRMVMAKNEKPQKHSNRTAFSNRLFCSICGEPFVRRTFHTTKKSERFSYAAWRCRTVEGRVDGKECTAKSYNELAIKHSFMEMLLIMKTQTDRITAEFQTALLNREPSDEDVSRMEYLQAEIDIIDEKLIEASELSMNSVAGDVYDDLTYELTEQLERYRSEWNQLNENKYVTEQMQNNYNWFMKQLDTIPDYNPKKEAIPFREDIFKRLVERGDVFNTNKEDESDGIIEYTFNIGIKGVSVGNHRNQMKLQKLVLISDEDNNTDEATSA